MSRMFLMPAQRAARNIGTAAWERQMTADPHVMREGDKLRLFYCGNGYGKTGVGTAVADALD